MEVEVNAGWNVEETVDGEGRTNVREFKDLDLESSDRVRGSPVHDTERQG